MIKAHTYVLTGITVFVLLLVSLFLFIVIPRGKPVPILESDMLFSIVREGDIICRLGDRFWSQAFKELSVADKRFSHMGIIHITNGTISVINAEGNTGHGRDFVNELPLEDFIKIARAIGVYRIKNIEGIQLSNLAFEYLNIPFDWQFDMNDESRLYCTELLYVILKRLEPAIELNTIFIKEMGKDIIPLEAISNSEYFSEIYFIGSK
jgi:hypothetical protein